jgi:preprotein translocase subunit SecY
MFLMWLGEQITARGIGNGISLIIFAGIVASLPSAVPASWNLAAPARCHRPDPRHHRCYLPYHRGHRVRRARAAAAC